MISLLILVLLIAAIAGTAPTWGYSSGWGYGPSGLIGLVLVIVVLAWALGYRL